MDIPRGFQKDIHRMFGEQGRRWLQGLPALLQATIEKWHLKGCSLSDELSFNLVCFAQSPGFGDVVLKIGVPHRDLFTEMEALALYGGRHMCRCYDSDPELGAMLLERVRPGWNLKHVHDQAERVAIAANLFNQLPRHVPASHGLPSYDEWIHRAFRRARRTPGVDARFVELVNRADHMWNEVRLLNRPRVLLHGDLHHMNILKDGAAGWKAIDPKGVTGMRFLEIPPFIENQLEMVSPSDRRESLETMIRGFADRMGESEPTVARASFVVNTLRASWTLKEHVQPNYPDLVDRLNMLLACVEARS